MTSTQVETVPLAALKPHPKNPRVHPDSAVAKLVASIREFGWTNPILLDADGRVLAGHARIKAAVMAGLTEVPVIRLPLSGSKADAYLIADNRLQSETDWDLPALSGLLGELKDTDSADAIGFDAHEWDELLAGPIDATGEGNNGKGGKAGVDRRLIVRPVLAMTQVQTFEQAIRRTGKQNRAEALEEICRRYLEATPVESKASGQFDPEAEGFSSADLA